MKIQFMLRLQIKIETDIWDGDECNAYNGTDATIVPPFLSPAEGLVAFDPVVCRSLRTAYTNRTSKIRGIPIHIFELDISDNTNTKKCFCRTKNNCPPHGSFDLFRCTGKEIFSIYQKLY